MKRAEYPERMCRRPVAGEYQMYWCELAEHDDDEPCASYSSPISVTAREAWERGRQLRAARAAKVAKRKTAAASAVGGAR